MIYSDYHLHTFRCKHATGEVNDYAATAVEKGISAIGFADHIPYIDNRWNQVRMDYNQLSDYEKAIDSAREQYPELKILKGLECEYDCDIHTYLENEIIGEKQYDFLIGSAHYTSTEIGYISSFYSISQIKHLISYAELLCKMIESKLFTFIGHPDCFGCCHKEWNLNIKEAMKDVFTAAREFGTLLEINGKGLRRKKIITKNGKRFPYPWESFWAMAKEYDLSIICNSDAHSPDQVGNGIVECREIAKKFNLTVVDKLKGGDQYITK